MDKFFNSDNMVMRTLSKIFDIGWLTLIYLVFCIPIVTVGAATTSLYYVSAKVLRHNRSYVWREFWHSFKTNFFAVHNCVGCNGNYRGASLAEHEYCSGDRR
ncbi:MAG: DUF624 domain-containing protein [Clostridium sp.]